MGALLERCLPFPDVRKCCVFVRLDVTILLSESFPTLTGMRTPSLSIRLEILSLFFFFQIGNWYCCIPFTGFDATLLLGICKLFTYKRNIKRQAQLHLN